MQYAVLPDLWVILKNCGCTYCERFQGSITKCFKQHLNAFDSCSLLLHLLDELLDDQFHVSKFSKCFVRLISWLGHFGGFSLILEDFSHVNIFQRTFFHQRFSSTNQRFSTRGLPTSSASRVLGHGASPSCWWWSSVDQQLVEGFNDWVNEHNTADNDCEALLGNSMEFYRFILIILVCRTLNRSCIREPGEFHELDTATSNRI